MQTHCGEPNVPKGVLPMPTMKVKLSDFAADLNLPVQELIRLR